VYPIIEVPDNAAELTEQLGAKPKFWFAGADGSDWLFKEPRPASGEDWSEKVACELCALIGLPHARYELALWRGRRGVVTPSFVPPGGRLAHGNELIAQVIEDYPTSQFFRVSQHTLGLVLDFMSLDGVKTPLWFVETEELGCGADVFVGYLMLDAWIANQDRHHENWGLVRLPRGTIHLAPSYDHASSLGRNESDERRRSRLDTRDSGHTVEAYVRRARSAFYAERGDRKPLSTLEAFNRAAQRRPTAAIAWLDRLSRVETASVTGILQDIPRDRTSETAAEFAHAILDANRLRLLEARRGLE